MLEKECSSCQLVVQPEPLSFGNWCIQVGEQGQGQAATTLCKRGNNNPAGTLRASPEPGTHSPAGPGCSVPQSAVECH